MISPLPTRRDFLAGGALALAGTQAKPRSRSFWLFGLLKPQCVIIQAAGNARLHCADGTRQWIIEGAQTLCVTRNMPRIRITGPGGAAVSCLLEIPGLIRRPYFGTVELRAGPQFMIPIVTMDCETASNSIVAAELPVSEAPFAALAAQAVVSRSVLFGARTPRHAFADFCDTTHCQFLRSPATAGTPAACAAQQTRGMVLVQDGAILPARYCAACGGRTEAGFDSGHRYISVPCAICRERKLTRRGHGWGFCQEGAIGLARRGCNWREILATYYPIAASSSLQNLNSAASFIGLADPG